MISRDLTVYENSEKYIITTIDQNIFLSFSKIKGSGEIIKLKSEENKFHSPNNKKSDDENSDATENYINHFFKSNIFHKTYTVYAIYGLLTIERNTFLIFVTDRECVGYISNYPVYKIKDVIIKELLVKSKIDNYLLKRAKEFFNYDGAYYSHFDIFKSMSFTNPDVYDLVFDYMFNYKLVKSFLELFGNLNEKEIIHSNISSEDPMTNHNLSDLDLMQHSSTNNNEIHFKYNIQTNLNNSDIFSNFSVLEQFIAKSIYGSFEYFTVCDHNFCKNKKECLLNCKTEIELKKEIETSENMLNHDEKIVTKSRFFNKKKNQVKMHEILTFDDLTDLQSSVSYTFILLSRRSHKNMGARYLRRGIKNGNPANAVETEQFIIMNQLIENTTNESDIKVSSVIKSSFLQLRGSIPLHWKQDLTFKYTPTIKFVRNYEPLISYHTQLQSVYKSIFYLNLIKSSGYESALNSFYCHSLQDNHFKYLHFDYKKEGVHLNRRKRREMLSLIMPSLRRNKFYMKLLNDENEKAHAIQQGIVRTNCIDSLDRTNVVQYLIGEEMIREQLSLLCSIDGKKSRSGSVSKFPSMNSISTLYLNNTIKNIQNEKNCHFEKQKFQLNEIINTWEFHQFFKNIWVHNGNRLSRQYSGTNALGFFAVFDQLDDSITSGKISNFYRNASLLNRRSNFSSTNQKKNNIEFSKSRHFMKKTYYSLCDGKSAIVRYFKNRFCHGHLQTTYDIITGSNIHMSRRKLKSWSFFHFYICITSVLFYMYYYIFYYGQSDFHETPNQKIFENAVSDMEMNLENFGQNSGLQNGFFDIKYFFKYLCITLNNIRMNFFSNGIPKMILIIKSCIPISIYDILLILSLSAFFTLVVYPIVGGMCFNHPYYE